MKKLFLLFNVALTLSITSVQAQYCTNSIAINEELDGLKRMGEAYDRAGYVVGGVGVALLAVPGADLVADVLAVGGFILETEGRILSAVADAFKEHQYGAPKGNLIPWEIINQGKPYLFNGSDGDVILITSQPGTGKLQFQQGKDMTWWKGIVVFEKKDPNNWREILCLVNDKKVMSVNNISPDLGNDYHVVLSKAKTFGVHTNMYLIENWGQASTNMDYTFNWIKD